MKIYSFWILYLFIYFTEGKLFYRILLFSVKRQHESAIGVHMSPSLLNLPPMFI